MDVYDKWKPVIDMIRPTEEKFQNKVRYDKLNFILNDNIENPCGMEEEEQKFRIFLSEYAEKHRQIEDKKKEKIPVVVLPPNWRPPEGEFVCGGDGPTGFLPPSLKVLSKIDIKGKNLQLKDNLSLKIFSIKFNLKWLEEYKQRTGRDWIQKVENELIEYLIDTINFELQPIYGYKEGKKNLYVDMMVDEIVLKDDGLYLFSKYEID